MSAVEYLEETAKTNVKMFFDYFSKNPSVKQSAESYVPEETSSFSLKLLYVLISVDAYFESNIISKLEAVDLEEDEILKGVKFGVPMIKLSGTYKFSKVFPPVLISMYKIWALQGHCLTMGVGAQVHFFLPSFCSD